ncbi:hypothetical protein YC2023_040939 [Brassica napus]
MVNSLPEINLNQINFLKKKVFPVIVTSILVFVLSFDQFMEHNKSFEHPEKLLELILQQLVNRGKRKCSKSITQLGRYVAIEHPHISVAT